MRFFAQLQRRRSRLGLGTRRIGRRRATRHGDDSVALTCKLRVALRLTDTRRALRHDERERKRNDSYGGPDHWLKIGYEPTRVKRRN